MGILDKKWMGSLEKLYTNTSMRLMKPPRKIFDWADYRTGVIAGELNGDTPEKKHRDIDNKKRRRAKKEKQNG